MEPEPPGTKRRKLLLSGGIGYVSRRKGIRKKKSVRGNKIGDNIVQVNLRVLKVGKKPLKAPEAKANEGEPADEQAKK